MKKILKHIKSEFFKIFFPKKCLICEKSFETVLDSNFSLSDISYDLDIADFYLIFKKLFAPFICDNCLKTFKEIKSPFCTICGDIFAGNDERNHVCGKCIVYPKSFDKARAAGVYTGALMSLIHNFKYKGKTELAKPLSILLYCAYLKYFKSEKPDFVIPVPLHSKKLKKRGFNQSYILIKHWRLFFQYIEIKEENSILKRVKHTKSQTGLTRKQREKNLKNSFSAPNPNAISGKKILIIDDVLTTGTTADECAKTLKKNGAKKVFILTLARTVMD